MKLIPSHGEHMLMFLHRCLAWWYGRKSHKECIRAAKEMREHLTEKQIDKALQDTFPASDPPAWY